MSKSFLPNCNIVKNNMEDGRERKMQLLFEIFTRHFMLRKFSRIWLYWMQRIGLIDVLRRLSALKSGICKITLRRF